MKLKIVQVTVGLLAEHCYVVSLPERDDCVVIDPGAQPERIRAALGGKRIAAILLTHGHFDHIGAVDELMDTGVELMVHRNDADKLSDPALNASDLVGSEAIVHRATRLLSDGDELELAGVHFMAMHTPGHTSGSVCFDTGEVLFTGDTIMRGGIGRTDLPTGSDMQMEASLRRLAPLVPLRTILGGHG